MEGMRAFVRAHRKQLDRETTYFVILDSVGGGAGPLRDRRGPSGHVRHGPAPRPALRGDLGTADRANGGPALRAEPLRDGLGTDALPARLASSGRPPITCLDDGALVPADYHHPDDLPDRIDCRRPGPRPRLQPSSWSGPSTATSGVAPGGGHPAAGVCDRRSRVSDQGRGGEHRRREYRGARLLWAPAAAMVERSTLTRYMRWLAAERGLDFADYEALWRWSVDELEDFWRLDLGLLRGRRRPATTDSARSSPRRERVMPGAELVRGHRAELRRARLPRQGRRRRRDPATPPSCASSAS